MTAEEVPFCLFLFLKDLFYSLEGRERKRQKEAFHLWVYSPDGHSS